MECLEKTMAIFGDNSYGFVATTIKRVLTLLWDVNENKEEFTPKVPIIEQITTRPQTAIVERIEKRGER